MINVPGPRIERTAAKTIAFDGLAGNGAVGTVAVFTITGSVLINWIFGRCTEDLASAGGGTIALGCASDVDAFIAATTATSVDNGNVWALNADSPGTVGLDDVQTSYAATTMQILKPLSENMIITVATGDVTDGTIVILCEYEPLSAGAKLA